MIICADCGSPQFLQIINSIHRYDEDRGHRFAEEYVCTFCGSRGAVEGKPDEEGEIYGDVADLNIQPRPQ